MIKVYGIPNCDTVKKARKWLDGHGIEYQFHNFKKDGITEKLVTGWLKKVNWEDLLNRRGTTWRKLPEETRKNINEERALKIMLENPSIIKRPVVESGKKLIIGFSEDQFNSL